MYSTTQLGKGKLQLTVRDVNVSGVNGMECVQCAGSTHTVPACSGDPLSASQDQKHLWLPPAPALRSIHMHGTLTINAEEVSTVAVYHA